MSSEEEPRRAGGGCVLIVLGGGALAVVFAVSRAAGVLTVWAVGVLAMWRAARRMSDSSATPPPGGGASLDGEHAGHGDGQETTLVRREGLLIYLTPDVTNPGRTHVAVERDTN